MKLNSCSLCILLSSLSCPLYIVLWRLIHLACVMMASQFLSNIIASAVTTQLEGEVCLPADAPACLQTTPGWYFNSIASECRRFYHGKCNQTAQGECQATCDSSQNDCTQYTQGCYSSQDAYFETEERCRDTCFQCFELPEYGDCSAQLTRWYYTAIADAGVNGACDTFEYSGCGGTPNNFPTEEACLEHCDQESVSCEYISCDLSCEFGLAVDDDGCPVCSCQPSPCLTALCEAGKVCAVQKRSCDDGYCYKLDTPTTQCVAPCSNPELTFDPCPEFTMACDTCEEREACETATSCEARCRCPSGKPYLSQGVCVPGEQCGGVSNIDDGGVIYSCNFDDASSPWCDMKQSSSDDGDWTRATGRLRQDTGPSGDWSKCGEGGYLILDASKIKLGGKVTLETPLLPSRSGPACFLVRYSMLGRDIGQLSIQQVSESRTELIFLQSREGATGFEGWRLAALPIPSFINSIIITASRGGIIQPNDEGNIAIDDIVLVSTNTCDEMTFPSACEIKGASPPLADSSAAVINIIVLQVLACLATGVCLS